MPARSIIAISAGSRSKVTVAANDDAPASTDAQWHIRGQASTPRDTYEVTCAPTGSLPGQIVSGGDEQ